MSSWARLLAVCVVAAPFAASAAPSPVVIARCGDSQISIAAGSPSELRAIVASPAGTRWSFTASIGLVRIGGKTRTVTVENLRTQEYLPADDKPAVPAALFIDLLLDDKKVILRHGSEGEGDPVYAADLRGCTFTGDAALAALVPPPAEPRGCADATVKGGYLTQIHRATKLPEADALREARALCEDHQKTIDARVGLEAAIADRAARDRIAARGPALMRSEETREKAWHRIDGCLSAAPSKASGVKALHEVEAKVRACYSRLASRLK